MPATDPPIVQVYDAIVLRLRTHPTLSQDFPGDQLRAWDGSGPAPTVPLAPTAGRPVLQLTPSIASQDRKYADSDLLVLAIKAEVAVATKDSRAALALWLKLMTVLRQNDAAFEQLLQAAGAATGQLDFTGAAPASPREGLAVITGGFSLLVRQTILST
jgi:hypothetical protein